MAQNLARGDWRTPEAGDVALSDRTDSDPQVRRRFNNITARGHVTYTVRAADGEVLYVGLSSKLRNRLRAHRAPSAGSGWYPNAVRIEVARWATRSEAALDEQRRILALTPRWNVAGTAA